MNQTAPGEEFVIALGHHPLDKTWLHPHDEKDLSALLQRRGHVYLAGHGQKHDSAPIISGGNGECIRVVTGASYGGRQDIHPQGQAYNIGVVLPPSDDNPVRLRIYPRRFSFQNGDFRPDVDNVPEGKTYTEFELKDLNVNRPR